MYKHTPLLISAILGAALALGACRQEVTISEPDCAKPDVLCVGLVTGLEGIKDNSFNQLAWEGVQQAQSENVVDWVRYIETIDAKDYYQNITSLVEADYDIIVTIGEQNAHVTSTAANTYPDKLFIGVDQEQAEVHPNLAGLIYDDAETSFLAGALAAQVTKTGTVAGVFGNELVHTNVLYKEGFEAGVKYINPEIKIITTYQPGDQDAVYSEAEWGASAAARAIENGADVVFGAGAKVNHGALIETAKHPGLYCIGVNVDQWKIYSQAHSCLLSSAIKLITPGVVDLIKLGKNGQFPSGNYLGTSGLASYHDFDSVISDAVKAKTITIADGLVDGIITTGVIAP